MRACCLTFAAALSLSITAATEIPRDTYAPEDLEAACEEALKARRGVALLFLDGGATKELHIDQNKTALRGLKAHSEIVYIDVKRDDPNDISPPIYTIMQDPKVGGVIPRAAVMSPDLSEMWTSFNALQLRDEVARKTMSRVRKEAEEKLDGWKPGPGGNPLTQSYKWPMEENKYYEGTFDKFDGMLLTLIDKKTQRPASIEVAKLKPASVAFAKKLAALKGDAPATTTTVAGSGSTLETWTSSDGKALKAKFVSLADEKVNLELEGGKKVAVPLSRLSKESAARARELDAEDAFDSGS